MRLDNDAWCDELGARWAREGRNAPNSFAFADLMYFMGQAMGQAESRRRRKAGGTAGWAASAERTTRSTTAPARRQQERDVDPTIWLWVGKGYGGLASRKDVNILGAWMKHLRVAVRRESDLLSHFAPEWTDGTLLAKLVSVLLVR